MSQKNFSSATTDLVPLFRGIEVFDQRAFSGIGLDAKVLALEEAFSELDNQEQSFVVFIEHLIASPIWQSWDYVGNPYKTYCLELARAVDHLNQEMISEPPYHSRKHFKDVCLSLTILLMQDPANTNLANSDLQWSIDPIERWILLFCAIGHDFGHNGSTNRSPFELEKASIERLRNFLHNQECPPELMRDLMLMVESIILATDPKFYSHLWEKFASKKGEHDRLHLMSVLMIESDLLVSILPAQGMRLSERLAQEWQANNPELAKVVVSPKGRLAFLNKLELLSAQAKSLGLFDILSAVKKDLEIKTEES